MPAIAWWPGVIEPATVTHELVSTMDLYTTILSLAGIAAPTDRIIDGLNVTDTLLYGKASPHVNMFFWNGKPGNYSLCAVRGGKYKAHFVTLSLYAWDQYTIHNPPLLFDVDQDPSELWPLNTTNSEYTGIVQAFQIAAAQHQKEMVFAVDQMSLGTNFSLAVCCNWATNCTCNQELSTSYFPQLYYDINDFSRI